MTEARLAGRVVGVDEGNRAAVAWCAEVNAAVHSETCAVPDQRLVQEVALFKPLPSLRLQVGAEPVTRKVDRLSCVRFASARYSVPTRLIGTTVILQQGEGRLTILERATGNSPDTTSMTPFTLMILFWSLLKRTDHGPRPLTQSS